MGEQPAKKSITSLLMVASLIISGVAAAGILAYYENEGLPTMALRTGDELIYGLKGIDNSTEVVGTVSCHITDIVWLRAQSYLIGDLADEVEEKYNLPLVDSLGILTDTMWISTALGPKFVKEYTGYEIRSDGKDPVYFFSYRGVDSYIPYRINVSASDYHLSAELLDGTIPTLKRADSVERDMEVHMRDPPSERRLKSYQYEGGGYSSAGIFYVMEETTIKCTSDTNTSTALLFTEANLERMNEGSVWQYDTSISLVPGMNQTDLVVLREGLLFTLMNPFHTQEQGTVTIEIDPPG